MSEEALPILSTVSDDDLKRSGLPAMMEMSPGLAIFFNDALYNRCKQIALLMSNAEGMMPKHLLKKPEACFAVVSRAIVWRLDPFSVGMCTYQTPNGSIGYMGSLIIAILENSGRLIGPVTFKHEGDWTKVQGKYRIQESPKGGKYPVPTWTQEDAAGLFVIVSGQVKGEVEPRTLKFDLIEAFPLNSPLWATAPSRQICYTSARAFGNIAAASLMLGCPFDVDPTGLGGDNMTDITPPKPQRNEFERSQARDPAMGDWIAKLNMAEKLEEIGEIRAAGLKELPSSLHATFEEAADNRAHQIEASTKVDTSNEDSQASIAVKEWWGKLGAAKKITEISDIRAAGLKELPEISHVAWDAACDAKAKEITEPKASGTLNDAGPKVEPEKATAKDKKKAAIVKDGPETPLQRGKRLLARVDTPGDISDLHDSIASELSGAADKADWKQTCEDRTKEIAQ